MKPYKVSIKHYHNTNVKPAIIGGELYYPIFLLITAKRKTTRFKSLVFTELYTEEMYNEIMDSTDNEDITAIENELTAIEKIARITIDELNEFNTSFFVAYVNFSNSINIEENNVSFVRMKIKETILGEFFKEFINLPECIGVDNEALNLKIHKEYNLKRLITLFEFFNITTQQIIKEYLKDKQLKLSVTEVLYDLNKLHFYKSMGIFKHIIKSNKRTQNIYDIYSKVFHYENEIMRYIQKKYTP